jgi:ArsR family transcriptional regulator
VTDTNRTAADVAAPDCTAEIAAPNGGVTDEVLDEAVALLKGFADPTRLRILLMLKGGEVCVHQIVDALGMTQSAVSHQLRTLRTARLVEFTKRGRHVYYRLADKHVRDVLDDVVSHSQEVW